jgi:hypothetical protein
MRAAAPDCMCLPPADLPRCAQSSGRTRARPTRAGARARVCGTGAKAKITDELQGGLLQPSLIDAKIPSRLRMPPHKQVPEDLLLLKPHLLSLGHEEQ